MSASAIILTSPATEPEWHEAGILIDELIDWDFERFRALGFERADMVNQPALDDSSRQAWRCW